MSDNLKNALKSKLDQLDKFNLSEPLTKEQISEYQGVLAEAESLKNQIDMAQKAADMKAWGEQSAGSTVKASFDRMALPGEGEVPGVSADPRTGEMYAVPGAYKGIGEKTLAHLKSGAYKDAFSEYVRGKALKDDGRAARAMKVMNSGEWTAGEAWLPPDFRAELVKKMATLTSVRPNASVYTTGTNEITFPQAVYTTDDKYTSGVRFTWQGAGAQTSGVTEATNPVSGQIKIPVHLATAKIVVQRAQVEDNSFDLLGYLSELGSEAFSLGEEDAFTNGDGNGKPRGFLKHPTALISYDTVATYAGVVYQGGLVLSGDTDDIAWSGIIGAESALPPQYEAGAKWYANKKTYSNLRAVNAGTATLPQWSLGDSWPNYANGYTPSLLGYGIQKNQFMPNPGVAATTGPFMALGDMKGYFIADRVGLSVEVNPYILQDYDQIMIYMRKRVGGDLVHYWRMKYIQASA